jgi:hypothetical protein
MKFKQNKFKRKSLEKTKNLKVIYNCLKKSLINQKKVREKKPSYLNNFLKI